VGENVNVNIQRQNSNC